MSTVDLRFPRSIRLRKSGDFKRVQSGGRRVRGPDLVVLYLPGQAAASRVGLTVSRKVGNAVVRNQVKRWLREAIRHEHSALAGCAWDVVIIARPSALGAGAAGLRAQVGRSFRRLR